MLETWSEVDFGDQSKGFVHGSLKIFIDDNFGMTASLMVEIKDRPSYSTVITKYNIVAMQQPTGQIVSLNIGDFANTYIYISLIYRPF